MCDGDELNAGDGGTGRTDGGDASDVAMEGCRVNSWLMSLPADERMTV